jgi:hypothetical protein
VTYVRTLGAEGAEERATGDPLAGEAVYHAKGCDACHLVRGHGGLLGPDLSEIGFRRSLKFLCESVIQPDAHIAAVYRSAVVAPRSGPEIVGIVATTGKHLWQFPANEVSYASPNELRLQWQAVCRDSNWRRTDGIRSRMKRLLVAASAIAIATLAASESGVFAILKSTVLLGKQADGLYLLPTSQLLRPSGRQFPFPGRPVDLALDSRRRTWHC